MHYYIFISWILVGKRERKKGGFLNLDDNQYDPEPDISPSEEKQASPKSR